MDEKKSTQQHTESSPSPAEPKPPRRTEEWNEELKKWNLNFNRLHSSTVAKSLDGISNFSTKI